MKKTGLQRFEFTFELLWKTLRRIVGYKGAEAIPSPRDVFRQAFILKIIDNPEYWFGLLKYRNLTTHTYDEALTKTLFLEIPKIITAIGVVIADLQRL